MAVSQAQPPTSAEVEAHLRRLQALHPEWVRVRTVARTAEGRPLLAVTVTDRAVPDRDKQHVLITGGHHGSEESGRSDHARPARLAGNAGGGGDAGEAADRRAP